MGRINWTKAIRTAMFVFVLWPLRALPLSIWVSRNSAEKSKDWTSSI